MASKFILVPEEIYHGLTSSDSGNINLDFAKHALERTKRKRENVTAKNVNYNQELSRYLHLRNDHQNQPAKIEITKGMKVLIKKGDESDEDEQFFDLGSERSHPPVSQNRRQRRPHHHYHDDEEMPLVPASPSHQAVNRGQKRKANEYYSSWEEGAKRQLMQQYEPTSSSKIAKKQRRKLPPVSWRREEQQIPAEVRREEPFQPAPQPSIPMHAQLNRKRKAQQNLNDVREAKKSIIDSEELRPPPLQQEASLRFKQKTTNKPRVTQPQHSTSSALAARSNPPRDLLAEAAAAPLPDDDGGDDFELSQQPGTSAQTQPLPPGPPLASKTKKRKSSKDEKETEKKNQSWLKKKIFFTKCYQKSTKKTKEPGWRSTFRRAASSVCGGSAPFHHSKFPTYQ